MSEADLFHEIAELAAHHGETPIEKITPDTRLAADLGMDGDVAGEFMDAFVERFCIDLEGFHWLRYFGDEGWDYMRPPIVTVARLASPTFARRWRAAQDAEREITIAHLVEVATTKRWRHPGAEHAMAPPSPVVAAVLGALMGLPCLVLGLFGLIMIYGLVTGAIEAGLVQGAVAIAMASLPLLFGHASWRNIQRKLASA